MVTKEGAFANYKIIGVLVLTFILSAITVSALTITIDTPSSSSYHNSNVTIGVTITDVTNFSNYSLSIKDSASTEVFLLTNVSVTNLSSFINATWNVSDGGYSDGNFTINVTVDDNVTASITQDHSTLTGVVIDLAAPTGNIQFTDSLLNNLTSSLEADYGSELLVNCTPTDATANIDPSKSYIAIKYPGISSYSDNLTLTANTTAQVRATISASQSSNLGSYSVKCFVQDNAGNSLETILNFTTKSVIHGGTSPFIDEDFVSPIAKKVIGKGTMEDYSGKYGHLPEDGEAWLIKKLGGVRLMLAEEEHEVKVEEIEDESITLLISSEPFNVDINVNETIEVDVNADGINDLEIYLHKIHQKAADLVFKEITTPVTAGEEIMEAPVEESIGEVVEAPETAEGLGWIWTLIILIVVILILMILVHKFTGKGTPGSGNSPVKFTPRDLGTGKNASWGQKPSENSAKPFY